MVVVVTVSSIGLVTVFCAVLVGGVVELLSNIVQFAMVQLDLQTSLDGVTFVMLLELGGDVLMVSMITRSGWSLGV